jgi:hypothetical protein
MHVDGCAQSPFHFHPGPHSQDRGLICFVALSVCLEVLVLESIPSILEMSFQPKPVTPRQL